MSEKNYDIAIIGSGPGGYTAAIRASQLNFKVALIEENFLGGVCLNIGCIPTKALLTSADALDIVKKSSEFGIFQENITFDLEKMITRKETIVKNLRSGLNNLLISNKIDIINGKANLIDHNVIEIKKPGSTDQIKAKNIIIATGSIPKNIENIPIDHKSIFNSNSILDLKKLPKSLVIVGGGYIGCEFASFYARLGVKITIIEFTDRILFSHSMEISKILKQSFTSNGIDILVNKKVTNIKKERDFLNISLESGEIIQAEKALIAIGRTPKTSYLNLKKLNIFLGSKHEILVNEKMRTNISNIYAIGDVIGKWMLAHSASHEAIVAVENIAGIENKMDFSCIPSIIFTKPEIATVGLTEDEAKNKNIEIETGKFPFTALGKAHALSEKQGFVKVIIDKKTKQIIGAEVIGPRASVLIAEMVLAITNKLKVKDIIKTIHAHPTLPESWLEACLISQNIPINFPPNIKL